MSDTRRCPICGRPAEPGFKPFCSRRCSDVDLANWLGGRYAVPVPDEDAEEADPVRTVPGQEDEG